MKLYKRENYLSKIRGFYHSFDLIKVLTGVRRCGKSSIMQLIADELKEEGISEENIIYIDLEKRGYRNIRTADKLDEELEKTLSIKGNKYLFIDEVQYVEGFEEIINAYRAEENYSIFITGSNSYLLSGEITTRLTGRYMEFEIYTLSFQEYLEMKEFYHMASNPNLQVELASYLNEGGFPRTLFYEDLKDKRRYAVETVSEIYRKDIYKRIKIRNQESFNLVRDYIINNYGMVTNTNRIVNGLKAGGNTISRATVSRYIQTLVDAKILYPCERFDMKSRKMLKGEKKYYIADPSFVFIGNPDSRINYGPALENMVYIYARSKDYSVSVGRIGKLECDFVLKDINLDYSYVQISYTIMESKATEDREYRPLEMIRDNWNKYLLTTDYLLQKRNGIKHENLMEFLKAGKLF